MNRRIFVEKKGIFDVESPKILNEIKSILPNIQSVKVFNIYDIFGLDELEFEKVVNNTFVDPVVDILHTENPAKNLHFATEFLPDNTIKEQILHSNVSLYSLVLRILP
jgi:phosphoribosylformylglycinamidine synthase